MSVIGRLSSLALGIEDTPGDPVGADVYLPFTDVSMRGHHEPIEEIASKTSRIMDRDSVVGKKWAEGDVAINLDAVNSGYLWLLALGNETYTAGTPSQHLFYTSVSGNTPATATLIFSRSTDIESYAYAAIDELTTEFSDGLATMSASFQAKFPVAGVAQTVTTTSGTVFSFKDATVKFGNTLTLAAAASATAVNEFSMTISNNLEVIHQSGSADLSAIKNKGVRIAGRYTLFFDSETDKNAYYALNKRAMEVKFTGIANEDLTIRIPQFRLSEGEVTTGLDDFFVINADFVAEDEIDTGTGTRFIDVKLRNAKASAY